MNIEEYRAMKAQIENEQQNSKEEQTDVQTQQTATEPAESTTQTEEQTEPAQPDGGAEGGTGASSSETKTDEITIDGQTYKLDDVKRWKDGHMMQSDYTKKTQELAREKKEAQQALQFMQQLQANPDVAKKISEDYNIPQLDPEKSKVVELESKYYDLLLEKEVSELSGKYDDFSAPEVLQFAYDNKMNNLEDAYILHKSKKPKSQETQVQQPEAFDINSIKEQIRQEILGELKSNVDTSSIIQSGGDVPPVKDDSPKLSDAEIRVARNMGMNPKEYAKWRNKK
jgi:hypothetical protein